MKRELDMSEISDGRLYHINDMVRVGCDDCADCSECCRRVGNSIILDPYDIIQLEKVLDCSFEELLSSGKLELRVVDGVIQPNLKLREGGQGCSFLNTEGRCSIHNFRPGFCRLFPLGRLYDEDGSFAYFIQVKECPYANKTKVKVKQWLGIPDIDSYEEFIVSFHRVLKNLQAQLAAHPDREKDLNMLFLQHFYLKPYDLEENIYEALKNRIRQYSELVNSDEKIGI